MSVETISPRAAGVEVIDPSRVGGRWHPELELCTGDLPSCPDHPHRNPDFPVSPKDRNEWIHALCKDRELPQATKNLGLWMACRFGNAKGQGIFATDETIGKAAGVGRRQSNVHIKRLEAAGWLWWTGEWVKAGAGATKVYQVNLPHRFAPVISSAQLVISSASASDLQITHTRDTSLALTSSSGEASKNQEATNEMTPECDGKGSEPFGLCGHQDHEGIRLLRLWYGRKSNRRFAESDIEAAQDAVAHLSATGAADLQAFVDYCRNPDRNRDKGPCRLASGMPYFVANFEAFRRDREALAEVAVSVNCGQCSDAGWLAVASGRGVSVKCDHQPNAAARWLDQHDRDETLRKSGIVRLSDAPTQR